MVIIAFSKHTSKLLPRILCRQWRHCAPMVPVTAKDGRTWRMYQFVHTGNVQQIHISTRDMNILRKHGWTFICLADINITDEFCKWAKNGARGCHSCVQLTRRAIRMKKPYIQTPNCLMRKIITETKVS